MRIASVSKAFSGAVAMSLVSDGELSLDDTIGEIRPDLPVDWWPVTLRQLLSHTGGVPSFTSDPGFLQYFGDHLHGDISKLGLIEFVADDDLEFPPGTAYEYSNSDNIVIALMAEEATGRSYGAPAPRRSYRSRWISRGPSSRATGSCRRPGSRATTPCPRSTT